MALPALVGTAYSGSGTATFLEITLSGSGITDGNSIIVAVMMATSNTRTFTVTDSNGNTWPVAEVLNNPSQGSYIFSLPASVGLSGGAATITVTTTSSVNFAVEIQEVTPVVSAGLTDTQSEGAASNHFSGATGLTTNGDVLIVAVGQLNAAASTTAPGTDYVRMGSAQTNRMAETLISAAGLTLNRGSWSQTGTQRSNTGCMAAFYDDSAPPAGGIGIIFNRMIG